MILSIIIFTLAAYIIYGAILTSGVIKTMYNDKNLQHELSHNEFKHVDTLRVMMRENFFEYIKTIVVFVFILPIMFLMASLMKRE